MSFLRLGGGGNFRVSKFGAMLFLDKVRGGVWSYRFKHMDSKVCFATFSFTLWICLWILVQMV